jgi:hypothetical protein
MKKISISKHINEPTFGIVLIGFLVFIYMLFLNHFAPYFHDEFVYSYIYGTYQKISNISDIIISQRIEYLWWSGRVFTQGILQLFLLIGKKYFDGANSIAFVVFVFLLIQFSFPRSWNQYLDLYILFAGLILVWFCAPAFGETIMWKAGAVNYLWASCLMLIFLLPYRYLIMRRNIFKDNIFTIIGMGFLGFITGWSTENVGSIAILALLICQVSAIILHFRFHRIYFTLPKWSYSGAIMVIIGFIILMAAPGNYSRVNTMYAGMPFQERIAMFLPGLYSLFIQERFLVFIVVSINIMIVFLLFMTKEKAKVWQSLVLSTIFCCIGVGSLVSMAVSPEFAPRSAFAATVFVIAGAINLLDTILPVLLKNPTTRIAMNIGLTVALLLLVFSTYQVYMAYQTVHKEIGERDQIILAEKKKGNLDIIVSPLSVVSSRYVFIYDITANPDAITNAVEKIYYGLNSIILDIPSSIVEFDAPPHFDTYALYYDTGRGYNENEVVRINIGNTANEGNRISFPLPEAHIQNIRLNPGNTSNVTYKIKSLSIKTIDHYEQLDAVTLSKRITISHDIQDLHIDNGVFVFTTNGGDPYLGISIENR